MLVMGYTANPVACSMCLLGTYNQYGQSESAKGSIVGEQIMPLGSLQ